MIQLGSYEPYVRDFERQSVAAGAPVTVQDLKIVEGELSSTRVAACHQASGETPTVTISLAAWGTMSEPERRAAIFHELGHCVLDRGHLDELTSDELPVSIMNSHTIDELVYLAYEKQYMKELFTNERHVGE